MPVSICIATNDAKIILGVCLYRERERERDRERTFVFGNGGWSQALTDVR